MGRISILSVFALSSITFVGGACNWMMSYIISYPSHIHFVELGKFFELISLIYRQWSFESQIVVQIWTCCVI